MAGLFLASGMMCSGAIWLIPTSCYAGCGQALEALIVPSPLYLPGSFLASGMKVVGSFPSGMMV